MAGKRDAPPTNADKPRQKARQKEQPLPEFEHAHRLLRDVEACAKDRKLAERLRDRFYAAYASAHGYRGRDEGYDDAESEVFMALGDFIANRSNLPVLSHTEICDRFPAGDASEQA